MANLTLAAPQVTWTPPGPGPLIGPPLQVALAPIADAAGVAISATEARKTGVFLYRAGAGGDELWNLQTKQWTPAPADAAGHAALMPYPLAFSAGQALPWRGDFATGGEKDAQGADRLQLAAAGAPRYWLRGFAQAQRDGADLTGLGSASADLRFVAGTPLTLPPPTLDTPAPTLEAPVNLTATPLYYDDGSAVTQDEAVTVGVFVYRVTGAGEELWNDATQAWGPVITDLTQLAARTPLALTLKAGAPAPWQGVLVGAGMTDAAGAPRYTAAAGGVPVYRLRIFAKAKRNGVDHLGLGPPCADFSFASASARRRFTIWFDTDDAETATVARVQLKNSALAVAGYLEVRTNSGQEVEIVNCDAAGNPQAHVVLTAAGDVELRPAPNRQVTVAAPLYVDQLWYRPGGSGPYQQL